MKTIRILLVGCLAVLGPGYCLAQNGHDLFQKALVKERTEGDLEAAISLHERIVKECAGDRPLAAKALLHLGQCYEKLGKDEARKAYARLVQDYADQTEVVAQARTRLAALNKPTGSESAFSSRQVSLPPDVFGYRAPSTDGKYLTQLCPGARHGAPSPDGQFWSYTDWGSGNLAVYDVDTKTSRLLTHEGTWERPVQLAVAPKWSPDGRQLVYTWGARRSGCQLRMIALDAPKPRVLLQQTMPGVWVVPQDWSPSGEHILASIGKGAQLDQLALIPVEGGPPRVLKTFARGTIPSGEARFSPGGRYVVYDRAPGEVAERDVFVLDVSKGDENPLVQHPADDRVLGWSPDGNWVLFLSDRAGTSDLWATQVADGKPQAAPVRVKSSIGRIAPLGFTRDGSFYYSQIRGGVHDLYTARVDFETGTVLAPAEKAILKFEGSNLNPRYSPDGKSLAYVSRRGSMMLQPARGNALCVHSLETGEERVFMDEFTRLGVRVIAGPRWSPDSRSIVVAGLGERGAESGLHLVSLDTGEVKPVVDPSEGVRIRDHEWSREPKRLFYVRANRRQGFSQILELDLQTGEERVVYRSSLADRPAPAGIAVSPNGEWLAMLSGGLRRVLSVVPTGGGTPREVHRFEHERYTGPEWTPDGNYILVSEVTPIGGWGILYRFSARSGEPQEIVLRRGLCDRPSVHPDGRQIAFTSIVNSETDADVWVMENFLPQLASAK